MADATRNKEQSVNSAENGEQQDLGSSPLSVEDKIRKVFGEEGDIAVAVAKCESSLDHSRYGDLHMDYPSIGLFQINQTWHKYSDETLLDADENIRIAKEIRDRWGNWRAWTCWKNDGYKKFM